MTRSQLHSGVIGYFQAISYDSEIPQDLMARRIPIQSFLALLIHSGFLCKYEAFTNIKHFQLHSTRKHM